MPTLPPSFPGSEILGWVAGVFGIAAALIPALSKYLEQKRELAEKAELRHDGVEDNIRQSFNTALDASRKQLEYMQIEVTNLRKEVDSLRAANAELLAENTELLRRVESLESLVNVLRLVNPQKPSGSTGPAGPANPAGPTGQ